jgi:Skp family chaperone for outer membrane proteins
MSRRVFGRGLVLLCVLALAPVRLTAQQGGAKVGYLNSRAILLATPGYAQAESTYNKELGGFRAEVERLQNSLDSMAADFEQKSVMLSATAKTAKRKELEDRRTRLEARAQELREKAAQREQELIAPIHAKVSEVIEGVRAEGGYAMIFDVGANEGLIVTADKSLDLTQKVIDKLKVRP